MKIQILVEALESENPENRGEGMKIEAFKESFSTVCSLNCESFSHPIPRKLGDLISQ